MVEKRPLRKTNFLVGLVFLLASAACWKQAHVAAGWLWPSLLYFGSVFMFIVSWGPFAAATGNYARHRA